jgi:hypothetical protein
LAELDAFPEVAFGALEDSEIVVLPFALMEDKVGQDER